MEKHYFARVSAAALAVGLSLAGPQAAVAAADSGSDADTAAAGTSDNSVGRAANARTARPEAAAGAASAVDTDPRDVVKRHLAATNTINNSADDPIDLVVWPENVIDVVDFTLSTEAKEVGAEASRLNAPFAVGITEDVNRDQFTNAQVIVNNDGEVVDRYDKVRRVPFGEYMPMRSFLKSFGAPVDQVPRDALAGNGPAILDVPTSTGSERIGVVISWEVFFGGRARESVEHGAGFIINPTNGSSYTWTVLQSQQVASSKLRAIETGRWVVQVSPTGFSAFIDPEGHVHERTAVSEQKVISSHIEIRSGKTIYVVLGDKPWVVLIALVFLVAILNRSKSRTNSRA